MFRVCLCSMDSSCSMLLLELASHVSLVSLEGERNMKKLMKLLLNQYHAEGLCWTRTAERQTSSMRTEYLKSVLRQEVGFFDNQDSSSATFQVISNISADAHIIQDVIAYKVLLHLIISLPSSFSLEKTKKRTHVLLFSFLADTQYHSSSLCTHIRASSRLPTFMANGVSFSSFCDWIHHPRGDIWPADDEDRSQE